MTSCRIFLVRATSNDILGPDDEESLSSGRHRTRPQFKTPCLRWIISFNTAQEVVNSVKAICELRTPRHGHQSSEGISHSLREAPPHPAAGRGGLRKRAHPLLRASQAAGRDAGPGSHLQRPRRPSTQQMHPLLVNAESCLQQGSRLETDHPSLPLAGPLSNHLRAEDHQSPEGDDGEA